MSRPPPPGLTWVLPEVPLFGMPLPVTDGVHWLRMPLPFDLNHINLWLLDDGDAWTLVDTGASAAVTRDCWQKMFADNVLGRPVRRLILTHFHPDHLGLARWLAEVFRCEVLMSDLTWRQAHELSVPEREPEAADIMAFCNAHAVEHASEFGYFCAGGLYRQVVDGVPQHWAELGHGATLSIGARNWNLSVLGGHAEGHVVLHCPELNLVISGDQILPTITSNVSKLLDPGPAADPLGNYLASFGSMEALPKDVLVLPSHGRVFRGLHARINQLRLHHADTLDQVESLCTEPRSAGSLVPDLFPQATSGLNYILGFGETLAHLVHLREQGRIVEESGQGRMFYTTRM